MPHTEIAKEPANIAEDVSVVERVLPNPTHVNIGNIANFLSSLDWECCDLSGLPGAQAATLHGRLNADECIAFIKCDPGTFSYQFHHDSCETFLVVDGALRIEEAQFEAGNLVACTREGIQRWASPHGATLLMIKVGSVRSAKQVSSGCIGAMSPRDGSLPAGRDWYDFRHTV